MSYASVAAENAPPPSRQPHPDPALLTTPTTPPATVADDSSKVNVVPTDFKEHPATTTSEFRAELTSEGSEPLPRRPSRPAKEDDCKQSDPHLWQMVKDIILVPGVAGGLMGVVNIGLLSGAGYLYYTQPRLRGDARIISSTMVTALSLLGIEGYITQSYRNTPQGRQAEQKAKLEGSVVYQRMHEYILRPGILGGLLGLLNVGVISSAGYLVFTNWDRPHWDRRVVSIATLGLLSLWGGEGALAQWCRDRKQC